MWQSSYKFPVKPNLTKQLPRLALQVALPPGATWGWRSHGNGQRDFTSQVYAYQGIANLQVYKCWSVVQMSCLQPWTKGEIESWPQRKGALTFESVSHQVKSRMMMDSSTRGMVMKQSSSKNVEMPTRLTKSELLSVVERSNSKERLLSCCVVLVGLFLLHRAWWPGVDVEKWDLDLVQIVGLILLACSMLVLLLTLLDVFVLTFVRGNSKSVESVSKRLNSEQRKLLGLINDTRFNTPDEKSKKSKNQKNSSQRKQGMGYRVEYSSPGESVLGSASKSRVPSARRRRNVHGSRNTTPREKASPMPQQQQQQQAQQAQNLPLQHQERQQFDRNKQAAQLLSSPNYGGSPLAFVRPPVYSSFGSPMGHHGSPGVVGTAANASRVVCQNCSTPVRGGGSPQTLLQTPQSRGRHGTPNTTPARDTDEAAYQLLHKLIVEWDHDASRRARNVWSCIDDWTENVTRVLCKYVHEQIISSWERNCEQLRELPGDFFTQQTLELDLAREPGMPNHLEAARQRAFQRYNGVLQEPVPSGGGGFGLFNQQGNQQQVQEANQKKQEAQSALGAMNRAFEERVRLERSLTMSGPFMYRVSKKAVLDRLKIIFGTKDKGDIRYRISSSSADQQAPPYDADVVIHVACDWLDRSLRLDDRQPAFEVQHLRDAAAAKPNTDDDGKWWGLQRSTVASFDRRSLVPHYDVVVLGQLWNVRFGRHNTLQAIALLVYSMKARRVAGVEGIESVVAV